MWCSWLVSETKLKARKRRGLLEWPSQLMSPQLVEIRRQLVESRAVIADTRRNVVVNSPELGFNIVLYRSNSYETRSNSCYVAVFGKTPRTHDNPRHYNEICTTLYE